MVKSAATTKPEAEKSDEAKSEHPGAKALREAREKKAALKQTRIDNLAKARASAKQ